MSVKLLTEHHLEFLSFKGGCTGSSESTLVKKPNWWKSHVAAHFKTKINSYLTGINTICTEFGSHHGKEAGACTNIKDIHG